MAVSALADPALVSSVFGAPTTSERDVTTSAGSATVGVVGEDTGPFELLTCPAVTAALPGLARVEERNVDVWLADVLKEGLVGLEPESLALGALVNRA